ncbi:MAG: PAS domain S-box protein [Thermoanaerobaculia bacterium]
MARTARRIFIGAVLVVLAIIALAWVLDVNIARLREEVRAVERTRSVVMEVERTLSALKDAEAGQRGYLLTSEPEYLRPYEAAVVDVRGRLGKLERLTAANSQKQRVAELSRLAQAKLEELAETVRLAQSGDRDGALRIVQAGTGQRLMDQIRDVVDRISQEERAELHKRVEDANDAVFRVRQVAWTGAALLLALLAAFLLVVRTDLVGRRRAEEEARASETELRTTLRSIGDAVIATDGLGQITFLNPVAEALTGWTEADAVGRESSQVFRIVDEETRKLAESPIPRVLREGIVVGLANHTILIARDGRETPISDSGAPIRNPKGVVTGVVLVFRDITEQRAAQRAAQRWAAIVTSSQHAIIGETLDRIVTDFNPGAEALLGYKASEMIGRNMAELAPPGSPDPAPEAVRKLLATQSMVEFETQHVTRDGRTLDVLVGLSPVQDAAGKIVAISAVVRDITERRQARQQLIDARHRAEEANAAKDRFLATLSHELRTPLTPVMASLHRLDQRTDLPGGVAESLALIRRNVELEARLIDDLLDLTRIASGKLELDRAPMDLHLILQTLVQSCRSELFQKGLHISSRLEAADRFCHCDATRVQQVFWNLLKNAIKFTPGGGTITVRSWNPSPGRIRIEVADTGRGIRAEMLARIFDAFDQGEVTRSRRQAGLGLGLAIAKNLVEAHDGAITAQSQGEGRGATFAVELATTKERPTRPARALPGQPGFAARSATSVLLVEDDPDSGQALRDLLHDEGFDVRLAESLENALSVFAERPCDVLVTDLGLPDGSGIDLLARLTPLRPGLAAIVLSGYGMEEDILRSRAAGFSAHFVKPLNLARLVEAIDRVAAQAAGTSPAPAEP